MLRRELNRQGEARWSSSSGALRLDQHGDLGFVYARGRLDDPSARPISRSLPKRAEPFGRRETRPFFAGLLPEEGRRELVAKNLGISEANDFRGGEIAVAERHRDGPDGQRVNAGRQGDEVRLPSACLYWLAVFPAGARSAPSRDPAGAALEAAVAPCRGRICWVPDRPCGPSGRTGLVDARSGKLRH